MLFVTGRHPLEAGSFDWATIWLITVQVLYHAPFPLRALRSATSTVNPLILAFVLVLGRAASQKHIQRSPGRASMGGQDKQVAFEDAHSSASDEDAKAVEVTTTAPQCPSMPCDCTAPPCQSHYHCRCHQAADKMNQ